MKTRMKKVSWSYWKMKYCTTLVADKNKPVTSFSYHLKEVWIYFCAYSAFCQTLEGMVSWHTLWKFIFLRNFLTKSNGVFCKMQVISYSFVTWNYISIYSVLWKLLMRKVRLSVFLGHTVQTACIQKRVQSEKNILIWSLFKMFKYLISY